MSGDTTVESASQIFAGNILAVTTLVSDMSRASLGEEVYKINQDISSKIDLLGPIMLKAKGIDSSIEVLKNLERLAKLYNYVAGWGRFRLGTAGLESVFKIGIEAYHECLLAESSTNEMKTDWRIAETILPEEMQYLVQEYLEERHVCEAEEVNLHLDSPQSEVACGS